MEYIFTIEGLEELKENFKRNPEVVKTEVANFLTRAVAVYKSLILNDPWRIGMTGGGSPVALIHGGNLRDTHLTKMSPWEAEIRPEAPYASYVHFGTDKMEARPWLDYALDKGQKDVEKLENDMMNNILENIVK